MGTPQSHEAAGTQAPLQDFSKSHDQFVTLLESAAGLPELVAAASQARSRAADLVKMFRHSVLVHHEDEELELFPAVLETALDGEEARQARLMVDQLVAEHRDVARLWKLLEPSIEAVARGYLPDLDRALLDELVRQFLAHVRHEEDDFLPFAHRVLARKGGDMAQLSMALHHRHDLAEIWAAAVVYGAS